MSAENERETPAPLGWWAISGEAFLAALRRVSNGESPDLVYMEFYAHSDTEKEEGEL